MATPPSPQRIKLISGFAISSAHRTVGMVRGKALALSAFGVLGSLGCFAAGIVALSEHRTAFPFFIGSIFLLVFVIGFIFFTFRHKKYYQPGNSFRKWRLSRSRYVNRYRISMIVGLLILGIGIITQVGSLSRGDGFSSGPIKALALGLSLALYGHFGKAVAKVHTGVDEAAQLSLRQAGVIPRTDKITGAYRNFDPSASKYSPKKGQFIIGIHPRSFSLIMFNGDAWEKRNESFSDVTGIGVRRGDGVASYESYLALELSHGGSYVIDISLGEGVTDPFQFMNTFLTCLDDYILNRMPTIQSRKRVVSSAPTQEQQAPSIQEGVRAIDMDTSAVAFSAVTESSRQLDLNPGFATSLNNIGDIAPGRQIDL